MLNISKHRITGRLQPERYKSFGMLDNPYIGKHVKRNFIILFLLSLLGLFLPWTQNIQAKGMVTMLQPEQRPSEIQAVISGQIAEWYASEGEIVRAGDTIVRLREIKSEYLDPELILRTEEQAQAKVAALDGYVLKVEALSALVTTLRTNMVVKAQSLTYQRNAAGASATADSVNFDSENQNLLVAQAQAERKESLFEQGLQSRTEVEQYRIKLAQQQAKAEGALGRWENSQNKLLDAQLELANNTNAYLEKISKAQSDLATAKSDLAGAQGELSVLKNKLSSLEVRAGYYYILAPQEGRLAKVKKQGLGETVREGTALATIVPTEYELAVELYISPIDMPLIQNGSKVMFQFDGWPAIIFRGWPNSSYGTFEGDVVAVDEITNQNGKYRILIAPGDTWPENLRAGTGARGIALLNNVPVWYEIWRQLNSFPPDYYEPIMAKEKIDKLKIRIQ
jgi:multidrug efflux pump subunit AcrA (membrane-fusion protein)